MTNQKGQTSVEILILAAVMVVLLTFFVFLTFESIMSSFESSQIKMGEQVVETLADEIDDAYLLGIGTTKKFNLILPQTYSFDDSNIVGKTLLLNISKNNIIGGTIVDVNGLWPQNSGISEFTIIVQDGLVNITTQ